jgi:hypothetical protein
MRVIRSAWIICTIPPVAWRNWLNPWDPWGPLGALAFENAWNQSPDSHQFIHVHLISSRYLQISNVFNTCHSCRIVDFKRQNMCRNQAFRPPLSQGALLTSSSWPSASALSLAHGSRCALRNSAKERPPQSLLSRIKHWAVGLLPVFHVDWSEFRFLGCWITKIY